MKYLDKILVVYKEDRNVFQVIFWWELRRILYNSIVLFCGAISLMIMSAIVNVPPGEDLVEPIAVFGFAIVCNAAYTLGWFTELFRRQSSTYGPNMFKTGLYLT